MPDNAPGQQTIVREPHHKEDEAGNSQAYADLDIIDLRAATTGSAGRLWRFCNLLRRELRLVVRIIVSIAH